MDFTCKMSYTAKKTYDTFRGEAIAPYPPAKYAYKWNEELKAEYNAVMEIKKNQSRLSPYDPSKKLRLVIDGAKTVGTRFILIQYINDRKPEEGRNIINAGSCLLPDEKDYSLVQAEAIALD